jgi:hypothetical protein
MATGSGCTAAPAERSNWRPNGKTYTGNSGYEEYQGQSTEKGLVAFFEDAFCDVFELKLLLLI